MRARVPTLLLGAMVFLAPFAVDVSLPGLPDIAAALRAPGGAVQWTLAAYVLATAFGQLAWGPISDRFGRRPVLLLGFALFAASAFGCALISGVVPLIVLRFVQGLGACTGSVCAYAIVQDLGLEAHVRASRQAAISAITNIGPLAAPVAGVAILAAFGWRWLYAIPAVLALAVFVAVAALLPETSPRTPDGTRERYRRVLTLRVTMPLALTIFAWFAGYFAMISGSSFALVAQMHLSTPAFGAAFALEAASALLGSFVASRLARRFSSAQLLAAALALGLLAGLANGVTGIAFPSAPAFIATMSVYAFAFGVGLPAAFSLALGAAGPDAGVASGIIGAALSLGGAAGSAITGALPFAPSAAIGVVVAVAGCAAAAAFATLRITRRTAPN